MSLSQATFEAPTWAAEFALVKDELLLAVRRHVVVDAQAHRLGGDAPEQRRQSGLQQFRL